MDPETPPPVSLDTPPPSPAPSSTFDDASTPVIATNELGMITDEVLERPYGSTAPPAPAAAPNALKRNKRTRQPRKNVSRHFQSTAEAQVPARALRKAQEHSATLTPPVTPLTAKPKRKSRAKAQQWADHLPAEPQRKPRLINGLNIDDDLSSDSSLTSVPSSIGPDPFLSPPPPELRAIKSKRPKPRIKRPTKSPYFPTPYTHHPRPQFISSILPFPPLSAPRFGLMQERLAHDPFRLLVATIFLNKTPGARAMPVFYTLLARYPTPADLAGARVEDVVDVIRCLGFQNQRARKCVEMARVWVARPPVRGRRWAKRDYPRKGDGRGMKGDEWVGDEAEAEAEMEAEVGEDGAAAGSGGGGGGGGGGGVKGKVAWEIGHLPGLGAYAHDSWRMFCRDRLRGLAEGWGGEGAAPPSAAAPRMERTSGAKVEEGSPPQPSAGMLQEHHHPQHHVNGGSAPFEPEWKRVLPCDKELRAWMTWMWLKEGWVWNKETGVRTRAGAELMERARGGGIVREEMENECLVVEGVDPGLDLDLDHAQDDDRDRWDGEMLPGPRLDRPAGAFLAAALGK